MKENKIISAEYVNSTIVTKNVVNGKIVRTVHPVDYFESNNINVLEFLNEHPKKTLRSTRALPSSEFKLNKNIVSGTDILGNWFVTEQIRSFRLIGNGVQLLYFSVNENKWISKELYFLDNEYRDIFIHRLINACVPENNPRFDSDYFRHLK